MRRAGRGERPGRAAIQTYQPDPPAIVAVATGDANAFYDAELALRRQFGSPPYGKLIKLTVALPKLRTGLGADLASVQWVLNGYVLALAAFTLIGGGLAATALVLGGFAIWYFVFRDTAPPVVHRRTFVFRREGDRWLISHFHASDLPGQFR